MDQHQPSNSTRPLSHATVHPSSSLARWGWELGNAPQRPKPKAGRAPANVHSQHGRVVLFTDIGSPLARASLRAFAEEGADLGVVCAPGRDDPEQIRMELDSLGVGVEILEIDTFEPTMAETAVQRVIRRFGRLDTLINSVGAGESGPTDPLTYRRAIAQALTTPLHFSLSAMPTLRMAPEAQISNIIHVAGAAGCALMSLTRFLAESSRHHGVRVHGLHDPKWFSKRLPARSERRQCDSNLTPDYLFELSSCLLSLSDGTSDAQSGQVLNPKCGCPG